MHGAYCSMGAMQSVFCHAMRASAGPLVIVVIIQRYNHNCHMALKLN